MLEKHTTKYQSSNELFKPFIIFFFASVRISEYFQSLAKLFLYLLFINRQQPSPLLYSIDIWPARNSRLTKRETNHYITCCASVLAWFCLAGRSPEQLVIYLFALHQRMLYVVHWSLPGTK